MKDSIHIALLILRIYSGGLMIYGHGFKKLIKVFSGNFSFANPIGIGEAPSLFLAVFAEFFCALLVIIGYKTRLALIPLIITMIVAVFVVHLHDPFSKQEFGLLFLFPYIVLLISGPGKFSIDRK